jgi:hypothetical protein
MSKIPNVPKNPASKSKAHAARIDKSDPLESIIRLLESAEAAIVKQRVSRRAILCDEDRLLRAARTVLPTRFEQARVHQVIVRNITTTLDQHAAPRLKGRPAERLALFNGQLQDAFDATEAAAASSAYLIGMAKGLRLAWPGGALFMSEKPEVRRPTRTRRKAGAR